MFEKLKLQKAYSTINGYLNINNIIYSEDSILKRFLDFDKEYNEKNAKWRAGIKGYEKYTDDYVRAEKIRFIEELIDDYPGIPVVFQRLKVYLQQGDKTVFSNANMTLGSMKGALTIEEFLYNEARANYYKLELSIKCDETYKKR